MARNNLEANIHPDHREFDGPNRDDTDVLGGRIAAQLLDIGVLILLLGVLWVVLSLGGGAVGEFAGAGRLRGATIGQALVALAVLPLYLLYCVVTEGRWNGQTVGKKLVGIRVVSESGDRIGYKKSLLRNVPALVSSGLLLYIVAFVVILSTDRRQRLFDKLASTVVVKA